VTPCVTFVSYCRFPCGRWLGKGIDDGAIERLLVAELVPSTIDANGQWWFYLLNVCYCCVPQCFDAVGWATGKGKYNIRFYCQTVNNLCT